MNANGIVKFLAGKIDEETAERKKYLDIHYESLKPLVLFGNENSVFLRQVAKKAAKFNCLVSFNDFDLLKNCKCNGFIIDTETCDRMLVAKSLHGVDSEIADLMDVDCSLKSFGMPAVSEAIYELICECFFDIQGIDITIVGRGDSVQNLAKHLIYRGATVTVAHSQTKDMMFATMDRDIVIYATPQLTDEIAYDTHELVIDLGNAVPNPELFNCNYVNRIGDLTTSILMSRLI